MHVFLPYGIVLSYLFMYLSVPAVSLSHQDYIKFFCPISHWHMLRDDLLLFLKTVTAH